MLKLKNYSVETDNTVLLQFEDGSDKRVSLNHIGEFVAGNDLKKIQGALKVRKSFFKRHVPRVGIAVLASGLATLAGMTHQQQLNHIIHPTKPNQNIIAESGKATSFESISLTSQTESSRKPSPFASPPAEIVAGASTSAPSAIPTHLPHVNHSTHPKSNWLVDVMHFRLHRP